MSDTIARNAQEIVDGWLSTSRLITFAAYAHTFPANPYASVELLSRAIITGDDEASALAYFQSLDEDYAREQAAEALAAGGWDMHKINHKLS